MSPSSTIAADTVLETVRTKYAEQALRATNAAGSCCAPSCCGGTATADPITGDLYSQDEAAVIPLQALQASLGCGNPTALAELKPGETVLDLGSGGGIDVLLSAKRVGPTGFAYGLDMTDEMLALAEQNRMKAGAENVAFLKGEIEAIPLPDAAVDVIISNCVINLSADKGQVLREAYRVLRPGGKLVATMIGRLIGVVGHAIWWYSEDKHRDLQPGEVMGLDPVEVERMIVAARFAHPVRRGFLYQLNTMFVARRP
jgi:arsenite methyltransferase